MNSYRFHHRFHDEKPGENIPSWKDDGQMSRGFCVTCNSSNRPSLPSCTILKSLLPFERGFRTGLPERTVSHRCKWKVKGRSVRLLTRSLRGIHARAGINNMAVLAMKLSIIPPTFLRYFLSPEEEDTLFLTDSEEEFVIFSVICIFLGVN